MESSSDTSFYSEDQASYPSKEKMKRLKKSMTLDLDAPSAKKQKFNCLLSTPDLNMLKLGSPELERLLLNQNGHLIATPTPSAYVFPKNVTEEQESYVRGFEVALAELHRGQNESDLTVEDDQSSCDSKDTSISSNSHSAMSTSTSSSSQPQTTTFNPGLGAKLRASAIKEELQTVPPSTGGHGKRGARSPPMSPIDLVDQERIKLERKRLRNRLAATKCRQMKLERINKLEDKVKEMKETNEGLGQLVTSLRDRICELKEQLMEHLKSGCKVIVPEELMD